MSRSDTVADNLQSIALFCTDSFHHAQRQWSTWTFHQDARSKLGLMLFLTTIVSLALILKGISHRRARANQTPSPSTPHLEKARSFKSPPRPFGIWPPSSFRMPTPQPYPDWSITTTKPLPYRPFRYGPKYNVTMGLRNVKHEDWIELDNQFPHYHARKSERIASRGSKCCRTAPEALAAALELLEDLITYLPARYPNLYRRTPTGILNLHLNEHIAFPPTEDPIQSCARLVQDDLAIMLEKPDGQYYLLSGAILLPGFWRLSDKFGMPLSEIHTSGDVPQYREKLEKGMMNFFRRLKAEEMVARNNYFLQVDDDLAWSWSIGGEDEEGISWNTAEDCRGIEHHWFRSERQTLRRLPRSGGVVFTIRTYFLPVVEMVQEKGVPGRLASAVRSWGDDVSRYKGRAKFGDKLLEFLDLKHEEQVLKYGKAEMDRVKEEWEGYPF